MAKTVRRQCVLCHRHSPHRSARGSIISPCISCKRASRAQRQRISQKDGGRRWRLDPKNRAKILVAHAASRAKRRGLAFTLDEARVARVIERGVCEVTGLPFSAPALGAPSPWSPSLDRCNPKEGYTDENTKVVVWIYNAAKQQFTHEDVLRLAASLRP